MNISKFYTNFKEKFFSSKESREAIKYSPAKQTTSSALISIFSSESFLGKGRYGKGSKVNIEFSNKELPFAVKEFTSHQSAWYAFKKHYLVKQAKLPIWRTYRLYKIKNDLGIKF